MTSATGWTSVLITKNRWLYTGESDTPSEYIYTVTEQSVDGYQLSGLTREPEQGYTGGTVTYTAVNALSCGTVTVTNTVVNGSSVLPFTYHVKATLANGDPLEGLVNGLTFDSGEATFTLKHGEQKQLLLPVSVQVEVSQDTMPGYDTTQQTDTEDADLVPLKARATNGDRAGSVTVKFTNDLKVTIHGLKTVDGDKPEADSGFTYQLLDSEGVLLDETTHDEDGSFTFSVDIGLTDQETLTYTVQEADDPEFTEQYVMDTEPRTVTVTLPTEGGVTVSADEENPVTINNREARSFTVYKTWDDGSDLNISHRLTLYADGKKVSSDTYDVEVSDGNLTYTFKGLPRYNDSGKTITYSVKESAPSGYMAVYPGDQNRAYDGDTIRNISTMTLTIRKVWYNTSRWGKQTITLNLYKNGELYRTYKREPNDTGIYTFTIPYDPDGQYWFTEESVKHYKTTYKNVAPYEGVTDRVYDGGTITNWGSKPHTGDNTPVLGLGLTAVLSLAGLVLLRRRRR